MAWSLGQVSEKGSLNQKVITITADTEQSWSLGRFTSQMVLLACLNVTFEAPFDFFFPFNPMSEERWSHIDVLLNYLED